MPHHEAMRTQSHDPAVLVTGGSGFIGRRLVKTLAHKGETTISMYRHRLLEPIPQVLPVRADMMHAEGLGVALRNVKSVVHLAWDGGVVGPPIDEGSPHSLSGPNLPRNVQMLCNLIQAMEQAGTKRIVFLSANGASRHSKVPFLAEKYLAEFFILNSKIPERVIVRTSLVVGGGTAQDRFLKSILRVMRFPGFYPIPKVEGTFAPVHVDDVVNVLAELAIAPMREPSAMLLLNGDESYQVDEVFKLVSERYGSGYRFPLKGFLGSTLLPFFERDTKADPTTPRLRHYLALAQGQKRKVEHHKKESPLEGALPERFASFREVIVRPTDQ